MATRYQMQYLEARSLEPEEQQLFGHSTEGCCQVEPEWNSSGMSFPDHGTYFMRDEDNRA